MPSPTTPQVSREAVVAATQATRSTDAWCELALAAALTNREETPNG